MLFGEGFGANHRSSGAAGRRASHQAGHHALPQHRCVHHVIDRDLLAKQRQRVVGGMAAGLGANAGKGRQLGAVLVHVRLAGTAEVANGQRDFRMTHKLGGGPVKLLERCRPVLELGLDGSGGHLLEAQGQHALGGTAFDRLARQEQRRRAGGAIVVDVDDGDATHAHRVERPLAAGGIAIHIAHIGLLDHGVFDAGIGHLHRLHAVCRRHVDRIDDAREADELVALIDRNRHAVKTVDIDQRLAHVHRGGRDGFGHGHVHARLDGGAGGVAGVVAPVRITDVVGMHGG